MRNMKMLCLAVVAATALTAFVGAGTASAGGVLCSTTANPCPAGQKWSVPTTLDFSLKSGTSAKLANAAAPEEALDTCKESTIKGELTANPDANGEATTKNTVITWGKCTFPTTQLILFLGGFRVSQIPGTSNGTVRSDREYRITIHTVFFGSCVYGMKAGAHLGVLKEGKAQEELTGAEFITEEAPAEKLEGSNFACPEKSLWTATYVLTEPKGTTLSVSSS